MEPANEMDALLTQFAGELANKMGVSNDEKTVQDIVSRIRWYENKAGAIVIVKRGSDRTVLATISPKKGDWTHLYQSWAQALANLKARKVANGVSRLSHEGIGMGEIPLATPPAESRNE